MEIKPVGNWVEVPRWTILAAFTLTVLLLIGFGYQTFAVVDLKDRLVTALKDNKNLVEYSYKLGDEYAVMEKKLDRCRGRK